MYLRQVKHQLILQEAIGQHNNQVGGFQRQTAFGLIPILAFHDCVALKDYLISLRLNFLICKMGLTIK